MSVLTQEFDVVIREALVADDEAIAAHFFQLWLDNGLTEADLLPNHQAAVLQFIQAARQTLNYAAFVAEVNGMMVGSVGCQIFAGLYPIPFQPHYRKDGYIWGVYVEPDYRGQGIGRALTQRSVDFLKSIGCTRAVLNASPSGRPVYERLGFQTHNSMFLDL